MINILFTPQDFDQFLNCYYFYNEFLIRKKMFILKICVIFGQLLSYTNSTISKKKLSNQDCNNWPNFSTIFME